MILTEFQEVCKAKLQLYYPVQGLFQDQINIYIYLKI